VNPHRNDEAGQRRCPADAVAVAPLWAGVAPDDPFRVLFERSNDPIFLLDPACGAFADVNQAAVDLLRCPGKNQLIGARPDQWSAKTDSGPVDLSFSSPRFEWLARRADGVPLPLEVVVTEIVLAGRSLRMAVARDISGRKAAEAALLENQAILASIADNISEAIYRSDAAHRLIFVNQAYLRLFGYNSLAELQAVPREQLYADPPYRKKLLDLLAREGAFSQQEIEYVRKDGRRFWGLTSSRAIPDPATGAVAFHVGAIADITERRQTADEIRLLNATLERRIAERTAELAASEAHLRVLIEHAPEAIVVYDGDNGRFVSCNENAVRLFGVPREQLLRMTPPDLSPAFQADGRPSAEVAHEKLQAALQGKPVVFEWVHRHSSGRLVPCEVRLVRLPTEGRRVIRGSITDTSDRRRRELVQQATYKISEAAHMAVDLPALYARIHETIQGLMPAANFYIALLNPATGLIEFPYFRDEFDPAQAPRSQDTGLTSYVLRSGAPLLVDAAMSARKRRVGDTVTFEGFSDISYVESGRPAAIWLGVPLKNQKGAFGVMAVQDYRDPHAYGEEEKQLLTFVAAQTAIAIERKRSEQALRESEQKFRALFETSSQGVMLHDVETFLEVNPAALRIMGYERPEDLIGRRPHETAPPIQPDGRDSAVAARQFIQQCMEEGSARFDWMARSAQGTDIPLEVILTRVPMGGRQIIQAVINDISARKRAEADLRRALEREKELGALKSRFVSMVSHEFRTPLGIIISSAGILDKYFDRLDAAERREHLDSILRSTRRMGNLMEEVLLLARLDSGKLRFDPQAVDLAALCRVIADELASVTSRRCPIELDIDLPQLSARTDEKLIRHILANLLTNAVKYSEPGVPVRLSARRENHCVVFRVEDSGIGIPEEDREWLFQAFHRGSNVGQRSGTGLGLVIVQRCVELHGGSIEVDSAVNRGTRMTVRLPVFQGT
jgi:PAS domain S-box-containing protein